VKIRPRADADLAACVLLAQDVHEADGYPVFVDERGLGPFVVNRAALAAWVAPGDRELLGHVALHHASSSPAMGLAASATGWPPARLAVVARLLVSPRAQGQGIGRALLETAAGHAAALGRWPVLDVVTSAAKAITLYEHAGWRRAGRVTVPLPGGPVLEEFVYLGPRPLRSA